MLRSLVGSEMCIRDRGRAGRRGHRGDEDGGLDHQPGRRHGRQGRGRPGPCLLYTSDAADDLLCVDLGGSRIIKNKHTNDNWIPRHLFQPPLAP